MITPDCLDDQAIAAVVDGSATPSELDHLAHCGACRSAVATVASLLTDPAIAGEVRKQPAVRRWQWGAIAAAAAVFLIFVARPRLDPGTETHRGDTITAAATPVPIAPLGPVASAHMLTWSLVPGADRYHVTLFSESGTALFEAQLADTSISLPDSVHLVSGIRYLWKIEARTEWDRWATSDLVEFTIGLHVPSTDSAAVPHHGVPDSLRFRASMMSDSALIATARGEPLDLRDALSNSYGALVHASGTARDSGLLLLRRLASANAIAWRDSFQIRQVAWFASLTPQRQLSKVWVDSIRKAGVQAYSTQGASAALTIWRRGVGRATANNDSAGLASTLGNIGAAQESNGLIDSASASLERARRVAIAIGDIRTEANALSGLAGVREKQGDLGGARALYANALMRHDQVGDSRGLASDYNNLAGLARDLGDFADARKKLEQALAINRRDGRAEVAATNIVNLASLASLTGDFGRAESLYRDALGTWQVRHAAADIADVQRDLGLLALRRGDYGAATRNLTDALRGYQQTGSADNIVSTRRQLAGARAATGDVQGAIDELRIAQAFADSVKAAPATRAAIVLARADLAFQLNQYPEADALYASAVTFASRAGDHNGEAQALQGRGMLALARERTASAQSYLSNALRLQQSTGDARAVALTSFYLGDAAAQRGDTVGGRRQLARAADDLRKLGDVVGAAAALGEEGRLEVAARLPIAAEATLRAALRIIEDHTAPEVTWRLHAALGALRRNAHATDEAAREFATAIADIEGSGRGFVISERRSSFMADKWSVYADLAALEHARGRTDAAFAASERMHAGELRDMLTRGRVAAPADTSSALVAREQDLRRQINELTATLGNGTTSTSRVRGIDVKTNASPVREDLLQAQSAYGELLLDIRERAPRHAALVAPAPPTWRSVAQRLGRDEAIVEYLVSDSASMAFVITYDTLAAVPLGVTRHELAQSIDFVRGTLTPAGHPLTDSLWLSPLRTLHRALMTPIERSGLLAGKTRLTIVPHAELHYLPFAALIDENGGKYLIERYEVSFAPSVSVWLALANRKPEHVTNGALAFAPHVDALPGSVRELAAVSGVPGLPTRQAMGAAATEAFFRREAPTRRVIHLATYGVLNKQNPLFSFVDLGAGDGEDGRLETHEVFGLRLNADLVVLSACQTGVASGSNADIPPGDDWVGLARAFLSAGAARVMASLWPVQDRATAALMEAFYTRYRPGAEPATSLAAAQRALLRNPATASPYYWAGFEVIGGR